MSNRKNLENKKLTAVLAIILVIILAVTGILVVRKNHTDKKVTDDNTVENVYNGSQVIYHNGKKYGIRNGVRTMLVIGLDSKGKFVSSDSYNNDRQCDFLMLVSFDLTQKTCNLLQINRDTMANIPVLGFNGEKTGTKEAQLALAYTYGSGLEDSCKNTVDAVSDFLYGVNIDNYITVNMNSIAKLNDLVGGVTVTVLDEFSRETLVKGKTVKLSGEDALVYVRGRQGVGDETNLSRMARQRQYINAFGIELKNTYSRNSNFVVDAYDSIQDYILTDCTITNISDMCKKYLNYTINEIRTPEGQNNADGEYMEFNVDEENLKEIIIDMFYKEID